MAHEGPRDFQRVEGPLREVSLDPLTFRGTRFDIGFQLGRHFAAPTRDGCRDVRANPPPIHDLSEALLIAWQLISHELPATAEELRGLAEGAGVRLMDLLLYLYEDLWDSEDTETGCTDIAADARATLTDRLLVGHNNDEPPEAPAPALIRLIPDDGPVVTAVAVGGVRIMVGVNDTGLVLSGNQLIATDLRRGIPRIVLVRAALDQSGIRDAARVLLHEARTSSYNNVLADATGRVISIEGSGRQSGFIRPTSTGVLSHSNHYLHQEMQGVEGKGDMRSTHLREQRSCVLLEERAGRHSTTTFATLLRDHHGFPGSICRHGTDSMTVFSVIFEPELHRLWYVAGPPCQGVYRPVVY